MTPATKPAINELLNRNEQLYYQFETFTLTGNVEEYEFDLDNNYLWVKGFAIVDYPNLTNSMILGLKQFGQWVIKPIPNLLFGISIRDVKMQAGGSKVKIYIDRTRMAAGTITLTACFLLTNTEPTFVNKKLDYFQGQTVVPATTGFITERIDVINQATTIKKIWLGFLATSLGSLVYTSSTQQYISIKDNIKYFMKNFLTKYYLLNPGHPYLTNNNKLLEGNIINIPNNTIYFESTNVSATPFYPEIIYEYE